MFALLPRLDEGTQQGIDARLVSRAVRFEPVENVAIKADMHGLLAGRQAHDDGVFPPFGQQSCAAAVLLPGRNDGILGLAGRVYNDDRGAWERSNIHHGCLRPRRVGECEKSDCDPVLEFFRGMLTLSRWQLLSQATLMEE